MTISFNQIPSNLRVPLFYAEFSNTRANQGGVNQEYRTLLIGPRLSTGTVAEKTLQRVTSPEQAHTLFGTGSVLADMAERFLGINKNNPLYCVGLDDNASGVPAAGQLTFTGPATASGTIVLMIGGRAIEVSVAASDTAAAIATAAAAAIQAEPKRLVNAAVNGVDNFKVDLTARNDGTQGNEIDVSHSYFDGDALPAGVGLTITAMVSGLTNPDVDDVWPVIGDDQYLLVSTPWTDSVSTGKVEAELEERFGPLKQNDGYALYGKRGTFGTLTTFGGTLNSQFTSVIGIRGPSSPWQWAAEELAQIAASASIDPARPFQTLPLKVLAPKISERFTLEERNQLLHAGIGTFSVTAAGKVLMEGVITTYQTNAFDSPDESYLYLNTLLTLSYLRFDFKATITSKYPRHKLANDGTRFAPGQAVVTPNVIKAEAIAKFRQWESKALVEGFDQFKNDLIVERNVDNPNRLDVLLPPDLVNQLIVLGVKIEFLL